MGWAPRLLQHATTALTQSAAVHSVTWPLLGALCPLLVQLGHLGHHFFTLGLPGGFFRITNRLHLSGLTL